MSTGMDDLSLSPGTRERPFVFELNENPPIFKNLLYGLQWVLIAIPNVMIFSALCSKALGFHPSDQIIFSQRLLIATGLTTILQSLKGHRYPILEGPSSALLLSFIILAPQGLSVIEGGLIFGSLLLVATGQFRWFNRFSPLFTPNVVGVILILVAFTLLPFLYPMLIGMNTTHPYGELGVCGLSTVIILFVSFLSYWMRGFFQTTSMLAGILLGLIFSLFQGKVNLTVVRESAWLALPFPSFEVWPAFSLPAILSIVCTYLAVMINTVGSIQAMSGVVGKEGVEDRIHRGIYMTGTGGFISALLGVVGLVSVSISTGVVLVSRVASRYVLTMSGAIMIACAFVPKLWAVLTAIPSSIVAGVLFVVLSSQIMAGINVIVSGKKEIERREYFVVGLSILFGTTISFLPKPFFHLFPGTIAPVLSNGLVMGLLCCLLFEHLLFRQK
jgi:xanthine/uracil permease